MKRTIYIALAVTVSLGMMQSFPVCAAESGTCGENLTWQFDSDSGELTISGTGEMYDFTVYSKIDCPWAQYAKSIKSIVVEEGVTTIGQNAFNCNAVSATLPDSLTKIGTFRTNLETFTFPPNVTEIGVECFTNSPALQHVVMNDALTAIGKSAFAHCEALETVTLSDQLNTIPESCFESCTNLKEISGGDAVTVIDTTAFRECRSLCKFDFPANLKEIRNGAFVWTDLFIESLPDTLEAIGDQAFSTSRIRYGVEPPYGCTFSDDLRLPPNLKTIGINALPDAWVQQFDFVVTDSGFLYAYTGNAREVTIPNGVTQISAHFHYPPLETVYLTDDIIFMYEEAPSEIEALTIPATVTAIDKDAFSNCTALKTIRGYAGSYAQQFAYGSGYAFEELDETEIAAVKPAYGTGTLSIANTSAMLGTGYPMNEWHTAVFREAPGGTTIDLKSDTEGWTGSCYGLSALQILLDAGALTPAQFGAETIAGIAPTAETVSYINCLHQASRLPFMIGAIFEQTKETQAQLLARMIIHANNVNRGDAPFMLHFLTASGGMHAVAGYGLERGAWEWDGVSYDHRIFLWDSNYIDGNEKAQLYYDAANMHWCIPAYGIRWNEADSDAGMLRYSVSDFPALFQYFTVRYALLPGDLNSDAALTVADAVAMSKYIAEAEDAKITKQTGILNLDANADGYLDINDVICILRNVAIVE